ncbi:MAG: GNAT family N-acetyltransferase [Bacilli bacterium]|nr:GNAT family N-acetyltransferase [Bacilli bacterium]
MEIIDIGKVDSFLEEYIYLCSLEWGKRRTKEELNDYVKKKKIKILDDERVLRILGLVSDGILIGFVSLLVYDGCYRKDLTPWYATMYVKKEYRNKGYSKILNDAIINEAYKLGYDKVYLKTSLVNYYEKFGAIYIEKLYNDESLYYIDLNK